MANHKRYIKEALVIAALAAALGIIYNSIISRPLPWVREPQKEIIASDSALFGDTAPIDTAANIPPADPALPGRDTAKVSAPVNKDSLKLAAQKKAEEKFDGTAESGVAKSITYAQMQKAIATPGIVIIDARNKEEWKTGHIGNAMNIFPYDAEEEVINKVMSLPRDKTLIIYCEGGECDSSHKLAEYILSFGYKRVFIFTGGWTEWSKRKGK